MRALYFRDSKATLKERGPINFNAAFRSIRSPEQGKLGGHIVQTASVMSTIYIGQGQKLHIN